MTCPRSTRMFQTHASYIHLARVTTSVIHRESNAAVPVLFLFIHKYKRAIQTK